MTESEQVEMSNPLDRVINYLKHLCLVQFLCLIISFISLFSVINEFFELPLCCILVGLIISIVMGEPLLILLIRRTQRIQYKFWDVVATVLLFIIIVVGLTFFAFQTCGGNRCPVVTLDFPKQIVAGKTADLTVKAQDRENDPLAYYWFDELVDAADHESHLEKSGGPHPIPENKYIAPSNSGGRKVKITVRVDDHACGRQVEKDLTILIIHSTTSDRPTNTPTVTLAPTDTPTPAIAPPLTLSHTPIPTATFTATSEPTYTPVPTLIATATPRPPTVTPTPVIQPIKPALIAPAQGVTYKNPITFQWQGSLNAGEAYQVTLYHPGSNYTFQSELLWVQQWSTDLPGDRYGGWKWTVSIIKGRNVSVTSDDREFWFDPFLGRPTPTATSPPP